MGRAERREERGGGGITLNLVLDIDKGLKFSGVTWLL